jgi:hypothetical protein
LVAYYLSPAFERSSQLPLLEGSNLFRISKSLWSVLRRLWYSFPWGQFLLSLLVKMLSVSPVLLGFKVPAKRLQRERLRAKNIYEMEAGMPSFFPVFGLNMGPNKESVLFSKSSF